MATTLLSSLKGGGGGGSVPLGGIIQLPSRNGEVVTIGAEVYVRSDTYIDIAQTDLAGTAFEIPPAARIIGKCNVYTANNGNTSTTKITDLTGLNPSFTNQKIATDGNLAGAMCFASNITNRSPFAYTVDGGTKWFYYDPYVSYLYHSAAFYNGTLNFASESDTGTSAGINRYTLSSVQSGTAFYAGYNSGGVVHCRHIASSSPTTNTGKLVLIGYDNYTYMPFIKVSSNAAATTFTDFNVSAIAGLSVTAFRFIDGVWYLGGNTGAIYTADTAFTTLTYRANAAGANSGIVDFVKHGSEVHALLAGGNTTLLYATYKTSNNGVTWVPGIPNLQQDGNLHNAPYYAGGCFYVRSREQNILPANSFMVHRYDFDAQKWIPDLASVYGMALGTLKRVVMGSVGSRWFANDPNNTYIYELNPVAVAGIGMLTYNNPTAQPALSTMVSYMRVK